MGIPPAAALMLAASAIAADPAPPPDYAAAVRQELARLFAEASCDGDTCTFSRALAASGRTAEVGVRYSAATQTVYAYIDRFLDLADPEGPSPALARRLLDLNRQLVTSKLEWDRTTNCVRLSTVLSTDSNFDRKAFRSQLLGLLAAADRLLPLLASAEPPAR